MERQLGELAELKARNAELTVKVEENQSASDILNDLASKHKIHIGEDGEVRIAGEQRVEIGQNVY